MKHCNDVGLAATSYFSMAAFDCLVEMVLHDVGNAQSTLAVMLTIGCRRFIASVPSQAFQSGHTLN